MNKRFSWRDAAHISAFAAGFALLVLLANTYLIKTDTYSRLMLAEMQARDDIEVAFVGSSIVRDHFNTALISEATGKNCFSATIPYSSLPGSIAITEELYRTNSPEWTVLVVEPYTFETVREGMEAQPRLFPYLSSPRTKLDYYLRLCREDGKYIDRLFLFRGFGVSSPLDALKTVGLRHWPWQTYERLKPTLDPHARYEGGGFVRHTTPKRAGDAVRKKLIRQHTGYAYELLDGSKEQLLAYRDLVRKNGSNLLVLVYPNMTAHNLAEPSFLGYNESLMRFCRDNDIPFVNFTLARPELYPCMDAYYFDVFHMVGEGADIFSAAFARFFNLYTAGEDIRPLFYADMSEYLDAVDFITNTWISPYVPGMWDNAWAQDEQQIAQLAKGQDVFLANCNHGPRVTPEYRFFLRGEDGSETPLGPWNTLGVLTCIPGTFHGKTLRVYARPQGQQDAEAVWYDFCPGVDEAPTLVV